MVHAILGSRSLEELAGETEGLLYSEAALRKVVNPIWKQVC